MKRVALCIPTYERCDCIRDLIETCASYYLEYGIDIYLFDSSKNNAVEQFAIEVQGQYRDRLHYIRLSPDMHTGEKCFKIYEGFGYPLETYDYLWICSDSVQFTRSAIEKIMNALKADCDVVAVDPRDLYHVGSKTYSDANSFFADCAWGMSLLGASILKVDTVLSGKDWNKEEYLRDKIVDFPHVSFMFHQILKLSEFSGAHVSLEDREYRSSVYKRASGWYKIVFYIICESWVQVIEGLPNLYTDKEGAIFKGGRYSLGSIQRFRQLRMEGIFDFGIFLKYFFVWNRVCAVSRGRLLMLSVTPRFCLQRNYDNRKKRMLKALENFRKAHDKIFLYGAGRVGAVYAMYFDREQFAFEGFCVSDAQGKSSYMNHPLYAVDAIDLNARTGVAVSLQEQNAQDVLGLLEKRGMDKTHIFYSQEFYKMISYELGYRD